MKITRRQLRRLIYEIVERDADNDGISDSKELEMISQNMKQDEIGTQLATDFTITVDDSAHPAKYTATHFSPGKYEEIIEAQGIENLYKKLKGRIEGYKELGGLEYDSGYPEGWFDRDTYVPNQSPPGSQTPNAGIYEIDDWYGWAGDAEGDEFTLNYDGNEWIISVGRIEDISDELRSQGVV